MGAPVTHINSAISDPFNMLLGEKQMTSQGGKAMANSSGGYSYSTTSTAMAVADPFNMDMGNNVYVQHHIESARDAARVAHTNSIRADHQAALSRVVMNRHGSGSGGAVRGMHTVARGAMRFLK